MKAAVWKTGHHIADIVADALHKGLKPSEIFYTGSDKDSIDWPSAWSECGDIHIGYGILRGMDLVYEAAALTNKPYFELDNAYFNPGHFNGYYRISYKGTQAKWHDDIPKQDIEFKLEDWKEAKGKILICPPTQAVYEFFNLKGYVINVNADRDECILRQKGDTSPIDWDNVKGVYTFNSSIGWQALQRGIPVYSDPDHSIIGSYYKARMQNPIDFLSDEYRAIDREPLFKSMRAHQFTLKEVSEGKAWPLLNHYLRE